MVAQRVPERSPRSGGTTQRGRRVHALLILGATLLLASASYAAVSVAYTTSSAHSFTLKPAPVVWVAGPDSSGNNFVASFSLSSNATYYSITLKPVPEANVTWGNLTTLKNQDTVAYTVTVSGTSVSSYSKILDFAAEFHAYGTDALVGALDLRQGSPSVSLGALAAGSQLYVKLYAKLDTDTGAADLPSSVTFSLTLN
ncbi:MAG TPA: hypothetical protein VGR28_03160 [Candidatus Thermoplasmatota archaeon]|jgi:hypothetical protein|nr:hypothetical protein [Candidatus Thermoplasmatota archaeon]